MVDEQGYVHIVGRDKDLVISGGYNVYPKEVEQVIDELDQVAESAVIGLPTLILVKALPPLSCANQASHLKRLK
ncbi:hypothetical protein HORIV_60510 [Vreelandella olivaria]|uniref:Uncharacterized protein n=1 Tax=Vreelandella olivaria TaxID=390919 RepID=A0ABM7GPL7_9GAMM|nr:hypothetical protein HORIV_60510 [Halomonas olivaria]